MRHISASASCAGCQLVNIPRFSAAGISDVAYKDRVYIPTIAWFAAAACIVIAGMPAEFYNISGKTGYAAEVYSNLGHCSKAAAAPCLFTGNGIIRAGYSAASVTS